MQQTARSFAFSSVAPIFVLWGLWLGSACQPSLPQEPAAAADSLPAGCASTQRLVTVGGAITETVFALGLGDRVVGVDTSSVYPAAASRLPKVGYQRTLSAEGVLALRPRCLLAAEEAGPPHAMEQLRSAGVAVAVITGAPSLDGARAKITALAGLLGVPARGADLVSRLNVEAESAQRIPLPAGQRPRVLFLYARSAGAALIAGAETAPAALIGLAGADNAASGLRGFKPYSAEALVAARPDVLLLTDRGAASLGGVRGVRDLLGLSAVSAASREPLPTILTLDDLLLLGFGPRTGQAIAALRSKLASQSAAAIFAAQGQPETAGVLP